MTKKRRRQNRPRNRSSSTTTRTAERPRSGGRTNVPEDGAAGGSRRASSRTQPGPQRSRAEKKELARKEREAVRRQIARARRIRQTAWIAGIAAVVAVGVFLFARPDTASDRTSLPGLLRTEAPWDANAARSADRADALGLPAEGPTMHDHANVRIFVHGSREPVPADIGIDPSGAVQSVHTHDDSGTVHLESSVARTFTLGEFFGVWGVRLTPSCLGAYCNDGTNELRVYVDGNEVTGDPRDVGLDDQSVVVVTYGTADELPSPIPSTFDFSSVPQ